MVDGRWRRRTPLRGPLAPLVSIADEPADDDDARLRKRAAITAGYLTLVAPLTLPLQSPGIAASWVLAAALSLFSAANLAFLARTRRFERYVIGLISAGVVFVPLATVLGGGVFGGSSGVVWGFLIPAYAILALGPRRATPWFVAFLVILVLLVVIDPLVIRVVRTPDYPIRLISFAQNVGFPLSITFLLLRYTDVRRRAAEARADELLTNAIPAQIALRLRRGEQRIAESYPETTVLFADIVGFTPWAQRTDPARVVTLLDVLFSRLDGLATAHGVEKIKTVGDAYMAVAGAPEPRADHADAALALARAILAAVDEWRTANELDLSVRIGLASGPVVAGVIGERRILFDLWGDTVNLAARMESTGIPGRIQVASSTWALLGDRHAFQPREVDVRGIGTVTAYVSTP